MNISTQEEEQEQALKTIIKRLKELFILQIPTLLVKELIKTIWEAKQALVL